MHIAAFGLPAAPRSFFCFRWSKVEPSWSKCLQCGGSAPCLKVMKPWTTRLTNCIKINMAKSWEFMALLQKKCLS